LAFNIANGKLPEIHKARLRGLDLSESRLRHLRLFRVRLEDCDLRGADLTDFHAWRSEFERCDLSGADLTDGMLSTSERGEANAWRDCRFDALVLDGVIAKGAEFQRCGFEHVKWQNMVFAGCSFVDCRVTGSLENVIFYGTDTESDTATWQEGAGGAPVGPRRPLRRRRVRHLRRGQVHDQPCRAGRRPLPGL
jgi:uncharacterized protein YjbI with pentapeptide repeats